MKYMFVATLMVVIVTMCYSKPPLVTGGLQDADENDGTIRRMARFAVSEVGSDYSLVSVMKAQTQVVAGTLYHLKLDVERTYPLGNTKNYTCETKVLSQTWLGVLDLVEFHCSNSQ